jgi:hypothetical protein
VTTPTEPAERADDRFNYGLISDVVEVLKRHGYVQGSDAALGATVGTLLTLTAEFEATAEDDDMDPDYAMSAQYGRPVVARPGWAEDTE